MNRTLDTTTIKKKCKYTKSTIPMWQSKIIWDVGLVFVTATATAAATVAAADGVGKH